MKIANVLIIIITITMRYKLVCVCVCVCVCVNVQQRHLPRQNIIKNKIKKIKKKTNYKVLQD
jgi:hypothetical protein